jgi:hypothetical protein
MNVELDKYCLPPQLDGPVKGTTRQKPKRQRGLFIKGPIPLIWLERVGMLPGKSPLLLGLALRYQAGLEGSTKGLRLTGKLLSVFKLSKRTAHDALNRLEAAGLVSARRPPGQCRVVDIIDNA